MLIKLVCYIYLDGHRRVPVQLNSKKLFEAFEILYFKVLGHVKHEISQKSQDNNHSIPRLDLSLQICMEGIGFQSDRRQWSVWAGRGFKIELHLSDYTDFGRVWGYILIVHLGQSSILGVRQSQANILGQLERYFWNPSVPSAITTATLDT